MAELPSIRIKMPVYDEKWEDTLRAKLFEAERQLQEEEHETNVSNNKWVHHERPDEEWDVPITEEIHYFDPELSYELTGYRPITMEKGLDFDPAPFQETGRIFTQTGKYTEYPAGGKLNRDFWKEQAERCKNGYVVGKYRITGPHYYFLNFYIMLTAGDDFEVAAGRDDSFPSFLSMQYAWFHYVEMATKLKKDAVALKGRGTGWSEMTAAMAVCPYTVRSKYRSLLTCAAETKLDPLRDKCWKQLNFLDMRTGGGFKHLRQVKNNYNTKRASQLTKSNEEYGWMSEIDSVVADTSDKIRGDRCDQLVYEEAGSNRQLLKSWIQGKALVTLGGKKIGIRIALGTGGDMEGVEGLSKLFTQPDSFNVLPFKNYDTDDERPVLSGFFCPSHKFALLKDYLDDRGVTDYIRFKEYYRKDRSKLSGQALIDESAEHCFTPTEALMKHGENQFDGVAISERLMQLKVLKAGAKLRPISLLWDKNRGNGMEFVTVHDNPNSKFFIVEEPAIDESTRMPYDNLYVAGIDSIDQGKEDSASDYDVSDFCLIIMRRAKGMEPPRIVAMYKDRPKDIREAYDITMKALTWYNAKAVLEYTKISIIRHFQERKKDNLFLERPDWASGISKNRTMRYTGKRLIGVPSTNIAITHGLELVADFISDYVFTIDFEEMLQQLLNYTYEDKRKYDIVAALQMVMIGNEQLTGIIPSAKNALDKQWKDFGYYTDSQGRKRYGIIPKR